MTTTLDVRDCNHKSEIINPQVLTAYASRARVHFSLAKVSLMQKCILTFLVALSPISIATAADAIPPTGHPDSSRWENLFADDLSNAIYPAGIWMCKNGELTATKDLCIFSNKSYENFVVDLEFKLITARKQRSAPLRHGRQGLDSACH